MQLNSDSGVPYTLLAPPTVQDKKLENTTVKIRKEPKSARLTA